MELFTFTYQQLAFYGLLLGAAVFLITTTARVVANLIHNRTSDAINIEKLQKMVDAIPDDLCEKQGVKECEKVQERFDERINDNKKDIAILKRDTSEIKEVVVRLDAKFDARFGG